MTEREKESLDDIKARLNRETAKISWHELQRFFAGGNVLAVADGVDLLDVAVALHQDNLESFQSWLAEGTVYKVTDQQALQWFDEKASHWAVVVAPFVLVQEVIQAGE